MTICLQTPLTDADEIRALACRALVGLARSSTATQIMSKLPIFNNGVSSNSIILATPAIISLLQVLNMLLREPVLQDRRAEHVKFQKHAHELMARVSVQPIRSQNQSLTANDRSVFVVGEWTRPEEEL